MNRGSLNDVDGAARNRRHLLKLKQREAGLSAQGRNAERKSLHWPSSRRGSRLRSEGASR